MRQIIISGGIYQRFGYISPRTLLKFSFMLMLVLRLTTVRKSCNSLLHGIPKYLVCTLLITACSEYGSSHCYGNKEVWFDYWLPVHSRIIFKLLLIVYEALNGKAPSYISSILSHRTCSRSLRSSGQELLTVPLVKLKTYGDRALLRQGNGLTCLLAFVNLHQSLFLKDI